MKNTLETSGEVEKTTLQTSGEDVKNTLETSGEVTSLLAPVQPIMEKPSSQSSPNVIFSTRFECIFASSQLDEIHSFRV